jgi:hypothetical protein
MESWAIDAVLAATAKRRRRNFFIGIMFGRIKVMTKTSNSGGMWNEGTINGKPNNGVKERGRALLKFAKCELLPRY